MYNWLNYFSFSGEDGPVVKSSKLPERPVSFNKMEDVKRTWESSGSAKTKEELRAEHKKEISQIRSRLFQVGIFKISH